MGTHHNAVGLSCSAAPLPHRNDALVQQFLQDLAGLWTRNIWQTHEQTDLFFSPVIVCLIRPALGRYSLSLIGSCLGTWPGKDGTWTPSITTPLSVVPFETAESPRPSGLAPPSSCQHGEKVTVLQTGKECTFVFLHLDVFRLYPRHDTAAMETQVCWHLRCEQQNSKNQQNQFKLLKVL